jgi:pSer/pThr/pTyr-binding forkhead associated (FHA) protein
MNAFFVFPVTKDSELPPWRFDQDLVMVGRSPDCDVCVRDARFSRRHFTIQRTPDGFLVEDSHSCGGTYIDQMLIRGRRLIRAGIDVVHPNSDMGFMVDWADVTPRTLPPDEPKPEPIRGAFDVIVEHAGRRTQRTLDQDRVVIGQSGAADVPLETASLAHQHCVLIRRYGLFYAEDLGTPAGTRMNGERITGRVLFRPGLDRLAPDIADAPQIMIAGPA